MLTPRQESLYTARADIWRPARAMSGSKMTGKDFTRIEAAVPMYFETGQSQKGVVQFIQSESDNLFTLDGLHMEAGVQARTNDWVYQRSGPNAGSWWLAKGDAQVRSRRANKQKVLSMRATPPPALRELVAYTPTSLSSLALWHRAPSLDLDDAAAVTSWTDESGDGNTATQATAASQPAYRADPPAVRFATDYLAYPAAVLNPRLTSITVCAALRVPAGATGNLTVLGVDEITEIYFMAVRADDVGEAQFFVRDSASQSAAAGGTTDLRDGAIHVVTWIWDIVAKRVTVRVDGAQEGTATNAAISPATLPPGAPYLGMGARAGAPRTSMAFRDDLSEVVAATAALAGAELTALEESLVGHWGGL